MIKIKQIENGTQKDENKGIDNETKQVKCCQVMSIQIPIVLSSSQLVCGDILIETNEEQGYFQGFDIIHYLKPLQKVESVKCVISFHLKSDTVQINPNLIQVISVLAEQPNQMLHQFSQLLLQYSKYLVGIQTKADNIINSYKSNPSLFQSIIQERQFFIQKYLEQVYFSGTNKAKYDLIAWYNFSLTKQQWNLKNIIKSKKLIRFLGCDEEQIKRISLKKGKLNMFTLQSRILIQSIYLQYLQNNKESFFIQDFEIKTYDGITIACPFYAKIIQIDLPSHLLYNFETPQDCFEVIMHSEYDITDYHWNTINHKRNSEDKYRIYMQNLDNDFEYSIQSEMLIQKYYTHTYNALKQQDNLLSNQPNQYHNPSSIVNNN